jgi:glycosyltransferase involved in cell wall biosynthesis
MRREKDFGFLFVDDGSGDRTFDVLQKLAAQNPGSCQILKLEKNSGKAEAVRRGFVQGLTSGSDYLAFWDADLATPLEVLPTFLKIFEERPVLEMIFGARVKLMGHDIRRQTTRHYLGRIFATFASHTLRLEIYDTQCGAKMFRKTDTLVRMFETPFLSKWIFDVELIARFLKDKKPIRRDQIEALIYEMPLPAWYDVAGSKVKPGDFFKAIGELWRIRSAYK